MCAAVPKVSPYLYKYSGEARIGDHGRHISCNSFYLSWLTDVMGLFIHSAVSTASLSSVLSA